MWAASWAATVDGGHSSLSVMQAFCCGRGHGMSFTGRKSSGMKSDYALLYGFAAQLRKARFLSVWSAPSGYLGGGWDGRRVNWQMTFPVCNVVSPNIVTIFLIARNHRSKQKNINSMKHSDGPDLIKVNSGICDFAAAILTNR
jgi:hypothetical protein